MSKLREMNCITPKKEDKPLGEQAIRDYQPQIPEWAVINVEGIKRLQKVYKMIGLALISTRMLMF